MVPTGTVAKDCCLGMAFVGMLACGGASARSGGKVGELRKTTHLRTRAVRCRVVCRARRAQERHTPPSETTTSVSAEQAAEAIFITERHGREPGHASRGFGMVIEIL